MSPLPKAIRITIATLVVYALLVVTNLGEFWPFSIYPMFSRGGHPWSRALVRDVTSETEAIPWSPVSMSDLPGRPFALVPNDIDQIDLANFVSKTERWDDRRVEALRMLFSARLNGRRLLVMRADGRIDEDDSVRVQFIPYALLSPSGVEMNPSLNR